MSRTRVPKSKEWCFTLNNYTPEDLDRLSAPLEDVEYLIYGREIAETGTPHLQGTVIFQSRKRLAEVIGVIGQSHCTITRNLQQSIEYCKKDGDFTEVGTPPVLLASGNRKRGNQGDRCDLKSFQEDVKDGMTDMKDLREHHPKVCAMYSAYVKKYIKDQTESFTVSSFELRGWQETLNARLQQPPDPRKIDFVVDINGNQGKSWFARRYCDLHPNAQIIVPGKKADMAYVVDETNRVFFLDCPRSKQGDYIQYDFLEELKNGYVFSSKYESEIKAMAYPHVVVLMNEHPAPDKLSSDRYNIIVLT